MWWGKIIGFVLGYLLAGWFGGIIGFILGHLSDVAKSHPYLNQGPKLRQLFFDVTFRVMGYVAKSDGVVSEDELNAARQIMQRMGLSEEQKQRAMHLFTEGKNPEFSLDNTLTQLIKAVHGNFILLQVFADMQAQAVHLSGTPTAAKQTVLQEIFSRLGYRPFEFNYRQHAQQSRVTLNEDYVFLGIEESASNEEIKRAYRRLISKHHPDKLMAKDLPEGMMKLATEKAQSIQLAYDRIRKARGF
jgi:DnaJ like chaperone protein